MLHPDFTVREEQQILYSQQIAYSRAWICVAHRNREHKSVMKVTAWSLCMLYGALGSWRKSQCIPIRELGSHRRNASRETNDNDRWTTHMDIEQNGTDLSKPTTISSLSLHLFVRQSPCVYMDICYVDTSAHKARRVYSILFFRHSVGVSGIVCLNLWSTHLDWIFAQRHAKREMLTKQWIWGLHVCVWWCANDTHYSPLSRRKRPLLGGLTKKYPNQIQERQFPDSQKMVFD